MLNFALATKGVASTGLSKLRQALIMKKPRNRYLPWNWPIIDKALTAVFIPIIFKLKVAMIGTCKFTFGEEGFSRECKVGVKSISWDEVSAVNSLSGILKKYSMALVAKLTHELGV